jgi:DNA-binding MarR family transcriptional regulator
MPIDLRDCVQCRCLAARRTARAITRHFEAGLRPHGLRATQFSILAALALGRPKPMRQLADFLGLERTTLTRAVELMARNGWVRDGRSADARARPLRLTAVGRRKLVTAYPAWKAAQDSAARRWPHVLNERTGGISHGKQVEQARGEARA